MLVLLVVSVMAVPPVTQLAGTTGKINIVFPKNNYYPTNSNFTLHFHVFNSTGHVVTDADCLFHMYNGSGSHIVEEYLGLDSNGVEYRYKIPNDLLKTPGVCTYIVQCNNTYEAGWVSTSFTTNTDGGTPPDDLSPLTGLIFVPLFFAFLCIAIAFLLGESHVPFRIFMLLLSFISVSVSYNYVIKIIETFSYSNSLMEFIAGDYVWFGWVIYIVIIYFVIYWMIKAFNFMKGKEDDKLSFK